MAAFKRSRAQAWPEERGDREHGLYSLHRMFDIVGTHLTHRDVRVLSFLFVDVIDDYERGMIRSGRDFLLALERQGRCDETNFRQVLQLLRIITRHDLLPYVTLKRRRAGECPPSLFPACLTPPGGHNTKFASWEWRPHSAPRPAPRFPPARCRFFWAWLRDPSSDSVSDQIWVGLVRFGPLLSF